MTDKAVSVIVMMATTSHMQVRQQLQQERERAWEVEQRLTREKDQANREKEQVYGSCLYSIIVTPHSHSYSIDLGGVTLKRF